MDDSQLKRLKSFLSTQGSSIETLSKSRIKQLEKADEAIQSRLKALEDAKATLKSSGINISAISADTGISRKTFYNNDLLRLYVELYTISDEEKTVASRDFDRLKEKNDELLKQLQSLVLRDIETENLRHENIILQREIQNLNTRNQALEQQYEQAQVEIAELRCKLAEKPGHIIQMPTPTIK